MQHDDGVINMAMLSVFITAGLIRSSVLLVTII